MPKTKSRAGDNFWSSLAGNDRAYVHYFNRLMNMAISAVEWEGLPPEVDYRFLEYALISYGYAVFYKDELADEYVALTCTVGGNQDIYRIPNRREAYAPNGYHYNLDAGNSVLIYNDLMRTNMVTDILDYAKRLWNLDRVVDTNANAQKTPIMLIGSENERLTLKNLYKEYDGNSPVIYANKKLNIDGLTVLKTDAPYVADKIQELKATIWNEAMTYLGIANVNVQKKAQISTEEIGYTMGGVFSSRQPRLIARQQACEKINRMFGLNVSVKFRDYTGDTPGEEPETPDEEREGVDNE